MPHFAYPIASYILLVLVMILCSGAIVALMNEFYGWHEYFVLYTAELVVASWVPFLYIFGMFLAHGSEG